MQSLIRCFLVPCRFLPSGFALILLLCDADIGTAASVDYQRDVQPILAEHCIHCHGGDAETRQAGLRLDVREMALKAGESGRAPIVPGQPDESHLLLRVRSQNPDEVMPPPDQKNPLRPEQIEILERWIREGANYSSHWAFGPPVRQTPPGTGGEHPVDAFVHARLAAESLQPTSAADWSTLCRRLYLDVVGLPPSPAELEEFQRDGFGVVLDRLLQSERYGEKWARHWLDAARYSDTNGYEKDLKRDQWIWRDWVIRALNRDMPYNQFLVEQIAGDLLPDANQEQIVATGFLRNSMLNEEGAIVPEQFRMVEMFDRMDCVGKAILGLTTQCAQCHSHKFDPISQDEYYGMFAFLNNTYEAQSWVYTDDQQQQIREVLAAIQVSEDSIRAARPNWQQELSAWEAEILQRRLAWAPLEAVELGSVSGLNHPTAEGDRSVLMLGHRSTDVFMIAEPQMEGVTGIRLEALTHADLPFGGPGRSSTGAWEITELEVHLQRPGMTEWEKQKLVSATADFSSPEVKQTDGKKTSGPVSFLIDGSEDTGWRSDRGEGRRNQASAAIVQFDQPLHLAAGTRLKLVLKLGDMLGCCRFSLTTAANPAAHPLDHAAVLAMETASADRTTEQQRAVFTAWYRGLPEFSAQADDIESHWTRYPAALTSVMRLAVRQGDKTRRTHLLDRGNWDQPRQEIAPHTPAFLHPLGDDGRRDRLTFARWLGDERSPLTARVAVNRVWQAVFGRGIVETSEDFGTRVALPEYGDLLDWLAVDFMEHGWSQKHLIRRILTSATYQQSSHVTPELLERDPRNVWLARGPRFRAEAEVVRDIALSVSGLMAHRVGGPGVIPPVPQNVLDFNFVYPDYWKAAEGPERYRRAVYLFRKRSMPDPVMSSFDSPNADFACSRRVRSNTPLAALTGLNETIFVESAQAMAVRILREGGADDTTRADFAFQLCTSRLPRPEERGEILALLESRRRRLAEGWLSIREIATGDPKKLPELPPGTTPQDAAAWTLVARVMLNLDETISKN